MIALRKTQIKSARNGITLLEVLLAAVILAGALASLSRLATNGINASLRTEMDTLAALKSQTKLDEILTMPQTVQFGIEQPFPDAQEWSWIAELRDGPTPTLFVLSVTVTRWGTGNARASFELTRLVKSDHFRRVLADRSDS